MTAPALSPAAQKLCERLEAEALLYEAMALRTGCGYPPEACQRSAMDYRYAATLARNILGLEEQA